MLNNDQVLIHHLVDGTVIIAKTISTTPDMVTLVKPFIIQFSGDGNIGFVPMNMFGNPQKTYEVSIDRNHVIHSYDPEETLRQGYVKHTSGIVTPPKDLLLG